MALLRFRPLPGFANSLCVLLIIVIIKKSFRPLPGFANSLSKIELATESGFTFPSPSGVC